MNANTYEHTKEAASFSKNLSLLFSKCTSLSHTGWSTQHYFEFSLLFKILRISEDTRYISVEYEVLTTINRKNTVFGR